MSNRPRATSARAAAPDPPHGALTAQRVAADIQQHLPTGVPLLAFSGGADSTALLHALLHIDSLRRLVVAHVDHGLDPESAARAQTAERIARNAAQIAGWRVHTSGDETASREGLEPSSRETRHQTGDRSPKLPGNSGRSSRVLHFVHRTICIRAADRQEHGGREAAARALRYRALERLCRLQPVAVAPKSGSAAPPTPDYIITAHHADDQLETLVLRLRQGTGLVGLAGIRSEGGAPEGTRIHRPLLALERPPRGSELRDLLRSLGVNWAEDPSNADLSIARNLVRQRVLPALLAAEPDPARVHGKALLLARAAESFGEWREKWARATLDLHVQEPGEADRSVDLDLDHWRALPRTLRDQALGAMHRAAGRRADPPAAARAELHRQLAASGRGSRPSTEAASNITGSPGTEEAANPNSTPQQPSAAPTRCTDVATRRIACAAGSGWQWVVLEHNRSAFPRFGARLQLRREPCRSDTPTLGNTADFTYTPRIPGVTEVPEIGCSLQITREPFDGWMTRAWPDRAACHLPDPRAQLTVRNRTTGDTLHPFGSPSKRVKLKKLLIDRKIPRDRRSKLPLVCVDGEIAWVPGVTIGDSFRIPERLQRGSAETSEGRSRKSDRNSPSNDLVWVFRLLPMDTAPRH